MPINREWETYMMKAVLAETRDRPWPKVAPEIIERHRQARLPGYEAHILRLPQPILCKADKIEDVFRFAVEGKSLRIYPPFRLNDIAENAGAFTNMWVPEGESKITCYKSLPSTVSLSLSSSPKVGEGIFFCQGLRVDCERGAPERKLIELLLEQICQYTHQWWLRSGSSPFNGLARFGAAISRDYSIREELRYAGAGRIENTWYTARETQRLIGIEKPLDNGLWLLCCHHASQLRKGDSGLLAFHDAVAAYMSEDDIRCILNLCVCVEVLGNKCRILAKQKPTDPDTLLRTTDLVDETTRSVLQNLFVDRGHVAHGREPHLLGRDGQSSLESYLEATRNLVNRYLNTLAPGGWPDASQLSIKRKR